MRKPFGARFLTSSVDWNGEDRRIDEFLKLRAGVTGWSLLETLQSSEHGVTAGFDFSRTVCCIHLTCVLQTLLGGGGRVCCRF